MARPGFGRHPKFRLARSLLGVSTPLLRGHIELIWEAAYEMASPIFPDERAIEAVAEWEGEPGKLLAVLLEVGLLDQCPDGGVEIHDFWDHCPEYVRKRRKRREQKQDDRRRLEDSGGLCPDNDRHCPDSDRTPSGQCPDTDRETAAFPNPNPNPRKKPSPDGEGVDEPPAAPAPVDPPSADSSPPAEHRKPTRRRKPVPSHQRLLDLWAKHCPHLPQPAKWTAKRQQAWRARCREDGFLDQLEAIVRRIGKSSFLAGENDRGWMASIDWLLERRDAWVKVIEGRYDDRDGRDDPVVLSREQDLLQRIEELEKAAAEEEREAVADAYRQEAARLRKELEEAVG